MCRSSGTRDSIRINDWFTDADCRIEQAQTADNMFVTSSPIDLLVSVMAAFDPSAKRVVGR